MKPSQLFRILMTLLALTGGIASGAERKEVWVEVKSPHFVAYSDAGVSEAKESLREFEEIREVFRGVFPGLRVDAPKPMILLVFRDEESMKRFTPKEFEGKNPNRPAGLYVSSSDRNYALVRLDAPHRTEQPYFIVFHEYTHGILHLNFPALPTWLDEGIADFYGATEIRSDLVLVGKAPPGRLETMRSRALLPMATLMTVDASSPHYREGDKTGVFYSQSWALVHYLFMNEGAQKAGLLKKYLSALQENPDPLAAAKTGLGDLDLLQAALTSYTRQPTFRYWTYNLSARLADQDFKSGTLSEAEALVVKADYFQNTRRATEALPLLQQALALNPKLPGARTAMGVNQFLRHEREPAAASLEEAVRLGSDDFRAPYYLARMAQQRDGAGETARVFGHLEAARKLCPDFPGIHMLYCMEYTRDPSHAAQALEEGRRAVELEPENLSFRANLGYACMALNLEAQAKAVRTQLNALARKPLERKISERFETDLQAFLDRRAAMRTDTGTSSGREFPGTETIGGGSPRVSEPLKFRLPESLAPLGREVLRLEAAGKTREAILKVEGALSKTRKEWERKALQSMLAQLRARTSPAPAKNGSPKPD